VDEHLNEALRDFIDAHPRQGRPDLSDILERALYLFLQNETDEALRAKIRPLITLYERSMGD